jgi:hypothetical protein
MRWSGESPESGNAERGEQSRHTDRLNVHLAGLPTYLGQDSLVVDAFHNAVEVARTARSEVHSGFLPGLENARSASPKGEE